MDLHRNSFVVDMKMVGSAFNEKLSFKMLGFFFSSKLDWDSFIVSVTDIASNKTEPWFVF